MAILSKRIVFAPGIPTAGLAAAGLLYVLSSKAQHGLALRYIDAIDGSSKQDAAMRCDVTITTQCDDAMRCDATERCVAALRCDGSLRCDDAMRCDAALGCIAALRCDALPGDALD